MRILIIGGSGFIGSAIIEELLKSPDNEVHIFDRHPYQEDNRKDVTCHVGDARVGQFGSVCSLKWDFVVNLAGTLGTSEMFDQLSSLIDNIQSALSVLEEVKTGTILYPIMPEVWVNPYTISKISARLIHEMYARHLQRKSIMIRLFNVYGPKQKWEPVRKAVPGFIMCALKDEPIEVYGSGKQTMDLTYSGDVARAFVNVMKSPPPGDYTVIEVGTGVGTSVNQCVQDIIQCIGSQSKIVHVPMRKGEDAHTAIVCLEPYCINGGYSKWPTRLKEVVDWYNNQFVHRAI